jgi:hypothetical protein
MIEKRFLKAMEISATLSPLSWQDYGLQEKNQMAKSFISKFYDEIAQRILAMNQLVNLPDGQAHSLRLFLEQLAEGEAVIEDKREVCNTVCDCMLAAFESLLAEKLKSGEVKELHVLFLHHLPCALLRTPWQANPTNNAIDKKSAAELRVQTIRNLRDAGANLRIAYNASDYQQLATQSDQSKMEVNSYEWEKQQPLTHDYPLVNFIPEELMGELYLFKDGRGNTYQIIAQQTQRQNSHEMAKECRKIWFTTVGNQREIDSRTIQMLLLLDQFVNT